MIIPINTGTISLSSPSSKSFLWCTSYTNRASIRPIAPQTFTISRAQISSSQPIYLLNQKLLILQFIHTTPNTKLYNSYNTFHRILILRNRNLNRIFINITPIIYHSRRINQTTIMINLNCFYPLP